MNKRNAISIAAAQALGVVLYCVFVALFLIRVGPLVDVARISQFLIPAFMLSLLTFSVATVGTIIFGYPAYLAFTQHIKEALLLIVYTVAFGIVYLIFSAAGLLLFT